MRKNRGKDSPNSHLQNTQWKRFLDKGAKGKLQSKICLPSSQSGAPSKHLTQQIQTPGQHEKVPGIVVLELEKNLFYCNGGTLLTIF